MDDPTSPNDAEPPGKRLTWWHPLLVRVLEWVLRDSCEVREEVSVGRMPLRLDIVLIRRLETALPAAAFRDLAAISRRLNAFTLIEFKSPLDALERGDWNKLLGCAHLFMAQAVEAIRSADLTLMILAPKLTAAFARELTNSGQSVNEEEPGVHRIEGGAFAAYVMETDRVAGLSEPVMSLFCHEFADHPRSFVHRFGVDFEGVVWFMMQQIKQFRTLLPDFEVRYMTDRMIPTHDALQAEFLESLPVELRLRGISTQERLQGIPAEERLQGIPKEVLLKALEALENQEPDETISGE